MQSEHRRFAPIEKDIQDVLLSEPGLVDPGDVRLLMVRISNCLRKREWAEEFLRGENIALLRQIRSAEDIVRAIKDADPIYGGHDVSIATSKWTNVRGALGSYETLYPK